MQFTFLKSSIHHHVTSHPVSKLLRVTMQVVILDEPLRDKHLVNAHEAVPMLVQALLATHVTWLHHSVSTSVKRDMSPKQTEQRHGVIDRKDASGTNPALKTDDETYLQLLNK